jgi:pyruvate,orthophosphate dikinase
MIAAAAVVTEQGGATSHAAVVSRALNTPCVVGCGDGTIAALAGRTVTVDATAGRVYAGEVAASVPGEDTDPDLIRLTEWAARLAPVRVIAPTDPGEPPEFDADQAALEELGEGLPPIPPGTRTVRGALFSSDEGVRAALDAGVTVIAAAHRLPVLLTAIAHAGGRS